MQTLVAVLILILVPLPLITSGHPDVGPAVAAGAAALAASRPPGVPTPAH